MRLADQNVGSKFHFIFPITQWIYRKLYKPDVSMAVIFATLPMYLP